MGKFVRDITDESYKGVAAVTAHDTNLLPRYPTRGLWVNTTAGNIAVVMDDGTEVILKGLALATVYPFSVKQVKATGTTAVDIVALY